MQTFLKKYQLHLETLFVFILAAVMRLTSLNVFRAIDEEDRWAWAVDFYRALLAGDWSVAEASADRERRAATGLVTADLQWHLERGLRSLPLVDR